MTGRAPYFLIYENKELVKTIKNPFAIGGGGAGFGVTKMLENERVDLIIAGHFGDKITGALEERNIEKQEFSEMSVKEVLEKIN